MKTIPEALKELYVTMGRLYRYGNFYFVNTVYCLEPAF